MNKNPEKKNPCPEKKPNTTPEKIVLNPDQLCRLTLDCEDGLRCMAGMNCLGGEKNTPCDTLYYAPILDYQKAEKRLERRIMALFGHLEPEEMNDVKELREKGFDALEEISIREAQTLLDDVGRPLCRRDLLEALDAAILDRIQAFKSSHNRNTLLASWLLAMVLCRKILMDAAMPECVIAGKEVKKNVS